MSVVYTWNKRKKIVHLNNNIFNTWNICIQTEYGAMFVPDMVDWHECPIGQTLLYSHVQFERLQPIYRLFVPNDLIWIVHTIGYNSLLIHCEFK